MVAKQELTAVEKDKIEIDPDFDFRELAKQDYDSIPANVMGMFKWCGVYSQLQKGFFMIRLVTPGGLMTTEQFARAIELADQYAQGELCITTRQTLQFHWVRLADIHHVLEGMAEVGITTKNGCGDVTRNTVTCPLQGVCRHEVGDDVRRLIDAVATDVEIRDHQRNLPRKHKISIAGCGRACAQTLMNCQGWVPVKRQARSGSEETGWRFHAGGGLGARPYLAKVIFDWVPEALALDVARVTIEAFNRRGDRRKRAWARLKVVVDRMGATAFGELLLDMLRERGVEGVDQIEQAVDPQPTILPSFLAGQATIPQREEGLSTVRVMIPRSEMKTHEARELCRLADAYGRGEIMFTSRQNIAIRNVSDEGRDELVAELAAAGFSTEGHEHLPDIVACVGTTQCKMAVADTRNACLSLRKELAADERLWRDVGPLLINMNGCPNNCAHAWVADIGLRGRRRRGDNGNNIEGYSVFLGGSLSKAGHIGEPLLDVDATELADTLRRILSVYLTNRTSADESFGRYVERVSVGDIQACLASEEGTGHASDSI